MGEGRREIGKTGDKERRGTRKDGGQGKTGDKERRGTRKDGGQGKTGDKERRGTGKGGGQGKTGASPVSTFSTAQNVETGLAPVFRVLYIQHRAKCRDGACPRLSRAVFPIRFFAYRLSRRSGLRDSNP